MPPMRAVAVSAFIVLLLVFPARAQKPELVVETGHTAAIHSVAFSPDGRTLASGSADRTIKLWDVASGLELRALTGHARAVLSVAFSPDGRTVASGSVDQTIKLWDVASGRELRTFAGHTSSVTSVAFSPDGRTLASGSDDYTIKLWHVASGRELRTLAGHKYLVHAVAFSPDGRLLASGSGDQTIKLWDVASGRELRTQSEDAMSVAFSPDGRTLVSGADTNKLWDVASGRELRTLAGHAKEVLSIAFSPDGRTLASGSDDKTIKLWDTASGRELRTFAGHTRWVHSVAVSPDGQKLASGSMDSTIRLWDFASGRQLRILAGHTESAQSVTFSPDGRTLASGSADKTVKVWDVASGHELHTLAGHTGVVESVAFSADGRTLASGSMDKTIRLWDVASGRELRTLSGHRDVVTSLTFSSDDRALASGSDDGTVRVWDVASGHELRTLVSEESTVESVALSPNGRALASGSGDFTITLWDVASGRELHTLAGHTFWVWSVAFSPDGRTLASGSTDNTIKLWDVASGRELRTLAGHTDAVTSVAFSRDGRFVVSSSSDGSVRFWKASSGEQIAQLFALDRDDWAVVDPEGRFDASPGGMQLMHWVVGLEPIDLAQLKERYYEPGLLAKVLGFNKEPLHDVTAFAEAKLFPEVSFQPPAARSTKLELKLKNRGGGIGRVQVFVNGKELIADARGPKPDPSASQASMTVELAGAAIKPGEKNEIRVVTWNQEGYLSSRGFDTDWEPSGTRDLSPPDYYAIVAGVSDYSSPDLNLRFAAKDAADMATALGLGAERLFGAEHVHITVLTSPVMPGTTLATKASLEKAFESAQKARPGDILAVYLAGHGVAIQDTYAYPTEDARTLNLSDPAVRKETSVTSEEFAEWMRSVPALHQIMVLDTCNAGAAAEKLIERREVPGDQVRAIERLKDRTGLYVLMGAAADRPSYEASQFGQGLLTYALLKGMKGAALRDGEYIDVAKLFQEASDDVPELAKNIGGIQQPRIATPGGASFDIGKLIAEDRQAIPLANVKPLLVRPLFLNAQMHRDTLGVSAALRRRLQEEGFAPVERGGAEPTTVYIDEDDFPGAISPSGDYTVTDKRVEVTVVLSKDGKDVAQFKVEGSTDDLPGLTSQLADAIDKALPK